MPRREEICCATAGYLPKGGGWVGGQGLITVIPSPPDPATVYYRPGFGFTAHDLRRTAATLMADAGVPENIIPKILNHTEPGVTRRHYNLHAYRSEKRSALETWARYLEASLVTKQAATRTVVPFRRS